METIIVLPLYMVLIGGILWVGDLMLAKQTMVTVDRYAAWNAGNRQLGTPISQSLMESNIWERFFYRDPNKTNQCPVSGGAANRWWSEAYGGVSTVVHMPDWTRGWLEAEVAWYTSDVPGVHRQPWNLNELIQGRNVAPNADAEPSGIWSSTYEGHAALLRSPFSANDPSRPMPGRSGGGPSHRSDTEPNARVDSSGQDNGSPLYIDWAGLVNAPWPPNNGAVATMPIAQRVPYQRHHRYDAWSKN
jgi:hypothetical protein